MEPCGQRRPGGLERGASHRVNVMTAVAGEGGHFLEPMERIDLSAFRANRLTPVPHLEKVL